jgi:hypothetical protein
VGGEAFGGGWGGISLISGWYALGSLHFERDRRGDEAEVEMRLRP